MLRNCFLLVAGYDVYLVGGCVRDLILKQTPKDFDIITSAELKEVFFFYSIFFILLFELFLDWQFMDNFMHSALHERMIPCKNCMTNIDSICR
jgi:hypothetical protein